MSSLSSSVIELTQGEYKVVKSPVSLISSGDITVEVPSGIVHSFAGVVYYNDPNGDTPLDPGTLTGTATITVKTVNQPHGFQAVTDGALDASMFVQTSWDGNASEVNCSFDTITGATHAQLIVSLNKT